MEQRNGFGFLITYNEDMAMPYPHYNLNYYWGCSFASVF